MRAVVYTKTGDPDVLSLVDRPVPEPGPGEVRVQVHYSAVNPTDWKSRAGAKPGQPLAFPEQVPNQDGSGIVHAVGPQVTSPRIGQRVWLWDSAYQRANGTAQEFVVIPAAQAVPLPDGFDLAVAASLGVPARTAHRVLTVAEGGPDLLAPGVLQGRTVLVAGGAGAVGHATVQLARWAGATVITTVSSPEKAALAAAAGAHHVINYRVEPVADAVRRIAPAGVDIIAEVAPAVNAELDQAVIATNGVVAVYATDGGGQLTLPVGSQLGANIRWQFTVLFVMPEAAKRAAVAGVTAAAQAGVLAVGQAAGLPLLHFPLKRTADAHTAVSSGAVGKVLIDVIE